MDTPCSYCDQTTPHTIEKYCPVCQETKPHTAYHKNKAQPSGLSSNCKDCRNAKNKTPEQREKNAAYMRGWNGEHRELINANALEAYYELKERRETDPELDEHVKKLQRAKNVRYGERHPDRVAASSRNYARANKPKINKRRRERYAEDPSKVKEHGATRYALRRNAPINDFTNEDWEDLKRVFRNRCAYCGKKKPLTRDHITPLALGGAHTKSNIVPACRSCNGKKGKGAVLKPIQPMLL